MSLNGIYLIYSENRGNPLDHSVNADHNLKLFREPQNVAKVRKVFWKTTQNIILNSFSLRVATIMSQQTQNTKKPC